MATRYLCISYLIFSHLMHIIPIWNLVSNTTWSFTESIVFWRKIFPEVEKIAANWWLYLLSIGTFSGMGLIPGAKSPTTTVRIGALTTHSIKAWPLHSKVVWSQNRKSFRAITSFVSSVLKSKSSMLRIYQSDSCQNHDIPQHSVLE